MHYTKQIISMASRHCLLEGTAMRGYELLGNNYTNTATIPRGKDIYYHCLKCDSVVPSVPKDNVGCDCNNIFIDRDYVRLAVEDYTQFEVIRKAK